MLILLISRLIFAADEINFGFSYPDTLLPANPNHFCIVDSIMDSGLIFDRMLNWESILSYTGDIKYVGITKRDPHIRWQEHYISGTERAFLDYHLVKDGLSYMDARMTEQTLINSYGLENLYNIRNSISPKYWNK